MHTMSARRIRGFTIVELLVVTAVISLIVSLLLPAVQQARESARRTQCQNQLRQIGLALHLYHDLHNSFPIGGMTSSELSWHVTILPMIEQSALYGTFSFSEGSYLSPGKNDPHGTRRIGMFVCPSSVVEHSISKADAVGESITHTCHYYGIMGPKGDRPDGRLYDVDRTTPGYGDYSRHGLFTRDNSRSFRDVTDGTSNSLAVGEISWKNANSYRSWVRGSNSSTTGSPISGCKNVVSPINRGFYNESSPVLNNFNDVSLGSEHPGGANVAFCDGSVRFISEVTDTSVFRSSASINGGE